MWPFKKYVLSLQIQNSATGISEYDVFYSLVGKTIAVREDGKVSLKPRKELGTRIAEIGRPFPGSPVNIHVKEGLALKYQLKSAGRIVSGSNNQLFYNELSSKGGGFYFESVGKRLKKLVKDL